MKKWNNVSFTNRILLGLFFGFFIVGLAYWSYAAVSGLSATVYVNASAGFMSYVNVSSGFVALNVTLGVPATGITNATAGYYVNFTFFNSSGYAGNATAFNESGFNDANLNTTFNFSTLAEGVYNLSIYLVNSSTDHELLNTTNGTLRGVSNITVDRTPPSIVTLNELYGLNHSTSTSTIDLNVTVTDRLLHVGTVTFNITNTSATSTVLYTATRGGGNKFNYTLTLAELGEGNHTVTVLANDTQVGNNNNSGTVNITFSIDRTAPTVTVSCTPESTSLNGKKVTCTCSAVDTLSGFNTSLSFVSKEITPSTAGTITETCTIKDWAGNTGTGSDTYTVINNDGGSSGAGGGGGSGGGSSSTGSSSSETPGTEGTGGSNAGSRDVAGGGEQGSSAEGTSAREGAGTEGTTSEVLSARTKKLALWVVAGLVVLAVALLGWYFFQQRRY